jgi:hypothetical protein
MLLLLLFNQRGSNTNSHVGAEHSKSLRYPWANLMKTGMLERLCRSQVNVSLTALGRAELRIGTHSSSWLEVLGYFVPQKVKLFACMGRKNLLM